MASKHTFQTRSSPLSPIYIKHRNGTVQYTHTVGSHPQSKALSFTLDLKKSARTEPFFNIYLNIRYKMFFVSHFKSIQHQAEGRINWTPTTQSCRGRIQWFCFLLALSCVCKAHVQAAQGWPQSQEMAMSTVARPGNQHPRRAVQNTGPKILQFNKPQSKFPNPRAGLFVQL